MTLNVGIYLFPDVEVLDLAGPYEVFTTASRVHQRGGGEAPFKVFTVAQAAGSVRARAGLVIEADAGLDQHPPIDLLIVPGGVVTAELREASVIAWLARQARRAQVTASVCTGAFLLAEAGLLPGATVTTHWEDLADLARAYPDLTVLPNRRWVETPPTADLGPRFTSGGISAGIDLSLHLVSRLVDPDLAERTARQMDYRWLDSPL